MTHSSDTPAPAADALPTTPQPYRAPELTTLGSIEVLTAGPDSGNLDQIFGGTGGFQDSTS